MAKVTFSDEIKIRPSRQTFPKLSKLKKDDKVRIQLVDPTNIEAEYYFSLEAPVIENGAGVRNEDGSWKMRYLGSPISTGDFGTLMENGGLDVKKCPISAFAKAHPEWVKPARRKFAMHILVYKTKPQTFELSKPFSVEHMIWAFTDTTFQKLQEMNNEWEDMRKHDLYITCTNEKFQQYDIQVAPKGAWLEDLKTTKVNYQLAKDTYNGGVEQYPDLAGAIGNVKELRFIEMDLKEIEDAWNIVNGKGDTTSFGTSEDLDSLLDGIDESSDEDAVAMTEFVKSAAEDADSVDDFESLLEDLNDD